MLTFRLAQFHPIVRPFVAAAAAAKADIKRQRTDGRRQQDARQMRDLVDDSPFKKAIRISDVEHLRNVVTWLDHNAPTQCSSNTVPSCRVGTSARQKVACFHNPDNPYGRYTPLWGAAAAGCRLTG